MSKNEVKDLLGVLYDESRPGEYAKIDQILDERGNPKKVASIMSYRISRSRDTAWILCDADEKVVDAWVED